MLFGEFIFPGFRRWMVDDSLKCGRDIVACDEVCVQRWSVHGCNGHSRKNMIPGVAEDPFV